MEDGLKIAFYLLAPLGVISLFVPLVDNPEPKQCSSYSDNAGGYYIKCKDEYISLFSKMRMKKESPPQKEQHEIQTVSTTTEETVSDLEAGIAP